MPVRRRPERGADAWLLDFRVGGKRYRLTREAPNKRAAQGLERAARTAVEAGAAQQRSAATVAAAFARYWQEHGRFLASNGSERGYLNRWADSIGDDTLFATLTAETIAKSVSSWRSKIGSPLDKHKAPKDRQRVTDSTINHRLLCLQRIWNRAEELWGWRLARIPWRRLKLPERTEHPDRSIHRSEVRALLRALAERSRPIVMMALVTGLRRGALLRLQTTDVAMATGTIRAISKGRAGGRSTPVPITRAAAWVLRRNGPVEVGKLFPVSKQLLRQDWEAARAAIGRPDLRLHDLRHTFAQRLEDAGAGDLITDALHHSDPRLRRRYSHVRLERLRERLDRIGRRA